MCDCDYPRFQSEKIRTARKTHKCCECSLPIIPGEKYEYLSLMFDDIYSYKTCKKCADVRNWLAKETDCCVVLGQLTTELIEAGVLDRITEEIRDSDGYLIEVVWGDWFVGAEYLDRLEMVGDRVLVKANA
jgi:hypothetical protein